MQENGGLKKLKTSIRMENRKLANSDLKISPITFGGNVFGWTLDEEQSFKILDGFIGAGFNCIDTADTYARWVPGNKGGESETIIGNWLKKTGKRKDVIISTKVGGDVGSGKKDPSKEHIKQGSDDSLKRLQTDYIDLYQAPYDDLETPVAEIMTAFNDLIKEGKVRYIGASNLSAERIKESNDFARKNGLQPYISLQPLYNLYERQKFENEYLKLVVEEEMAVLPYYSLASGFLTGKYRSEADFEKSTRGKSVGKFLNDRGKRILKAMDLVADEQGVALSEIALAWLMHKPSVTSPIASVTNDKQLQQLINSTRIELNNKQRSVLDEASRY